MSNAPEPHLSACLRVLYVASLQARILGWDGENAGLQPAQCKRLVALMDAVHNIPLLLTRWEDCDVQRLRETLGKYDGDWGPQSTGGLLETFDNALGSALSK